MEHRISEKIKFMLISPEGVHYNGEVLSVELPGKASAFTVLPHHVNLVAELQAGMTRITTEAGVESFLIDGGFAEVKSGAVSAIVTGIINPESIDLDVEKTGLKSIVSRIIPPEERDFAEVTMQKHRARIQYSEKK